MTDADCAISIDNSDSLSESAVSSETENKKAYKTKEICQKLTVENGRLKIDSDKLRNIVKHKFSEKEKKLWSIKGDKMSEKKNVTTRVSWIPVETKPSDLIGKRRPMLKSVTMRMKNISPQPS